MNENSAGINSALTDVLKKQEEILEKLERNKVKDLWDKLGVILPLISGILIAGVGGYFTYIYDSNSRAQEARIKELQEKQLTIEIASKELDHLNRIQPLIDDFMSGDQRKNKMAFTKLSILLPKDKLNAVTRLLEEVGEYRKRDIELNAFSKEKLGEQEFLRQLDEGDITSQTATKIQKNTSNIKANE